MKFRLAVLASAVSLPALALAQSLPPIVIGPLPGNAADGGALVAEVARARAAEAAAANTVTTALPSASPCTLYGGTGTAGAAQAVGMGTGVTCSGNLLNATGSGTASAGGAAPQVQFNNGGTLGGFTVGGDGALVTSTGVLTISKIGGVSVSLGGPLTLSGANALILTTTGATSVTLPTSGTLTTAAALASEASTARAAEAASAQRSANLGDLASASAARVNLGLAAVAASGAYADLTGTPTLGTAAAQPVSAFDASGAAAAAQSASAQKAANLSDLASAATARTNLGLGTAATTAASAYDASGAATAAQAAAQAASLQKSANLSDVANSATALANLSGASASALSAEASTARTNEGLAAQKAANLSDLSSASAARTNLGLGTAATTAASAYDAAGAAAAEQTRATGAEGTLTSGLAAEINRATAAEATKPTLVNGVVPTALGGTNAATLPGGRGNLLPITLRAPLGSDTAYPIGSNWLAPDGSTYQLDSLLNGVARWTPTGPAGRDPGAMVSGLAAAYSTRRVVPTWTGSLFDVWRSSDQTSTTIATLPDGSPNVSALAAFLALSGGIGRVCKIYEQNSTGYHAATPTVNSIAQIASCPKIDMTMVQGNNVPISWDETYRNYRLVLSANYAVTGTSGASAVTLTSLTGVLPDLLPGDTITGSGIPAGTMLGTVNYTTGALGLVSATTGAAVTLTANASNVNFLQPHQWLDIPNGFGLPATSWTGVVSMQNGAYGTFGHKLFIVGVHGADALSGAGAYGGVFMAGLGNTGARVMYTSGGAGQTASWGPPTHSSPQVVAVAIGGTGGRAANLQLNGLQSTNALFDATTTATTMSGGALGANQQFISGTGAFGDFLSWDFLFWPTQISLGDISRVTLAIDAARGWSPQAQVTPQFVADGSSTTAGNGTTTPRSWPGLVSQALGSVSPGVGYNLATGGTMEMMVGLWASGGPGTVGAPLKGPLLVHWGQGNSLQASATFSSGVSRSGTDPGSTAPGTVTTPSTVNGVFGSIGAPVTVTAAGVTGVSAGVTTGFTGTSVSVSALPTGAITAISVVNSTAAQMWTTGQVYCTQGVTTGYGPIELVGSATRGTFTGSLASGQFAEFNNWKTIFRENWRTLAGAAAFVDLEDDPLFGGDPIGMTVVSTTPTTITVNALSAYAAAGSRIKWAGMPTNPSAGTGGQYIASVSGSGPYVITLAGSGATTPSTSGLSAGSKVQALNLAPWTAYPAYWNSDHQHFTPLGYAVQAAGFAAAGLAAGVFQ